MSSRCLALLALVLLIPSPAQAEPGAVIATVESDIDGDGKPDSFQLIDADGSATLKIAMGSGETIVADEIAWVGGIGQKPELEVTPQGSVQVISMNESIGRDRWHLTLTLAYRDGAVRVAGYTWNEYDTLDNDTWTDCDLNLLTGRGVRETAKGKRKVRTTLSALPITQWNYQTIEKPDVCR